MRKDERLCGGCGRKFESHHDNNFCDSCIQDDRDEEMELPSVCPRCDHDYDEIDQEYQMCGHCGYNANTQITDRRLIRRSFSRFGIDPNVKLDDWS